MQVTSQWLDGLCFVGTTENGHSVVMEGAAAEGGVKRGPSPMEMLLLGVAGCSSIDVVMIAEKQRQKVSDCRATAVRLSAEKYCSASIMLGKAAAVSHSFEIVECV